MLFVFVVLIPFSKPMHVKILYKSNGKRNPLYQHLSSMEWKWDKRLPTSKLPRRRQSFRGREVVGNFIIPREVGKAKRSDFSFTSPMTPIKKKIKKKKSKLNILSFSSSFCKNNQNRTF